MLGIDVSKAHLACALLDPATDRFYWQKSIPNTADGVTRLLALTPPDVAWVLEPTGRYSLPVVKQARAAGRRVLLAPPRKAKAYHASLQDRAKTDRLDSRALAQFAASRPKSQALADYPVKSEAVEQLDQLLSARKGIVLALASLRQRLAELPYAAEPLQAAVLALEGQRQALDEQIAQATENEAFAEVTKLQKVEGIGPVTSTAVVSRLKGRQFAHADQFVAYIGLDVGVLQSGKRKGQRGLTKQGDAELRRLLYLCAQSSLRAKSSPFRAHYDRELARGRKKTEAICIIARKLARLCWSLVTYGTDYDRDRVYRQGEQGTRRRASGENTTTSGDAGGGTPAVSPAPGVSAAEIRPELS